MFKLPNGIPNIRTSAQDWADYAEYTAIKESRISLLDLIKKPLMISDETVVNGIEDDTDKFINKADEISAEINYRIKITKGNYPFKLLDHDYSLSHNKTEEDYYWVYKYLLFATRLDMTKQKVQSGIDGTQLFERLSAEIALSYFGANSYVDVLGTSKSNLGGFRQKLADIVSRLKEGGSIHQNEGYRPQDDKVDVIVWKGFTDKLSSQMIAFGQCKTGTTWRNNLSELDTEAFCDTWFSRQPVLRPLRMFFCAQYFPRDTWYPLAKSAGLVFDRFRIIDYLPQVLDQNLLGEIKEWASTAEILYKN
jgi:hypothetical protein